MAPQDIHKKLNTEPFSPFRVYLTDGKTYDVTERGHAYMLPTEFIIGLDPDESGFPRRAAYVSPNHVVRVEPLPASPAEQH